jgi:uncharacterized membrane protein YccC
MSAGFRRTSDRTRGSPAALTAAVRAAGRFDRHLVSLSAGLLAAVPVVALLGGGLAAGDKVAAVTMGAGAMLVGIAWRTTGGRPPLALMATDAVVMAISTFVGCVTGSITWLHLVLLCLWSLMGGLLVGAGNRGGVVGTQAIIAVVVFGRFSEPPAQALGLAALVLAGGLTQVVFLGIVRWPPTLRSQRAATAAAYRELAVLAAASADTSTLPAASALDDAEASLASPTLFSDPAMLTLRSLVSEGHRLRIQLSGLQALLGPIRDLDAHQSATDRRVRRALSQMTAALDLAARAIEGDRNAVSELPELAPKLTAAVNEVTEARPERSRGAPDAGRLQLARRLSALAGQLRAVSELAPTAGRDGRLRSRRPQPRTDRPLEQLLTDLAQIRANATLDSPAVRHAIRLAVIVPAAELIARELPLQRSYWMVVAAATVLRPEFGATFTRGTERALGTCLGVALAGAISVGLHPAGGAIVLLVGLLAVAAYALFPASFALGFGFITSLVVFLLNAIAPDTLAAAGARLLDTLIGGTLGLLAYALWPTWSRASARQSLADLVQAQRQYLTAVLTTAVEGRQAKEPELRPLDRRARLARTQAEAAVARSLSEPETRRIAAEQSQAALGALRRLIRATHLLRLEGQDARDPAPRPALAPLVTDTDRLMRIVERTLGATPVADSGDPAWPDLRADYLEFEHQAPPDPKSAALLSALDEIVDAADGLAAISGLDWVDGDRRSRRMPGLRRAGAGPRTER